MKQQKKVSILIPSWFKIPGQDGRYGKNETFEIAYSCLQRLIKITPRDLYELIIIDNGSTLDSLKFFEGGDESYADFVELQTKLESYWSHADILIRNTENLGFGPAVEQGVKVATGEYIMQLNNDILFWEGWLEIMLEDFEYLKNSEEYNDIGLLMPSIIKDKSIRFPEVLDLKKEDISMPNKGKWGKHAQFGSCWMLEKDVAWQLIQNDGFFFDPQFEMLFKEDRDLYERIYKMGLESYRSHNLRCHHVGNLTVSKVENRKEISAKNRERFEAKWKK